MELLAEIGRPNCKLGFDAWSPALRGEDVYAAAKNAAPHTVITTNADYVRVPRYRYRPDLVNYERLSPDLAQAVPFGTGFIDYAAFFRGLRDGGFDGIATYEICSPIRGGGTLENLDASAVKYLAWMREHRLLDSSLTVDRVGIDARSRRGGFWLCRRVCRWRRADGFRPSPGRRAAAREGGRAARAAGRRPGPASW